MTDHITVLDHGFVALESVMGSDLTVVNAARVSFAKRSELEVPMFPTEMCEEITPEQSLKLFGHENTTRIPKFIAGEPTLSSTDAKLIRYLAWHDHWTPFGHPQITLRLKMPIFVARQWMRSNVGIVYNEVSRRYVSDSPEFYAPSEYRPKPLAAKQGSGSGCVTWSHTTVPDHGPGESRDGAAAITEHHRMSQELYESMLVQDVAPEQARMVLPVSSYTEFWMTASLAALARVVGLRIDGHAQWEVQQYAAAVSRIVAPKFPVSWKELLTVCQETAAWRAQRYKEIK